MPPFLHLSWLDYPIGVVPPRIVASHTLKHVCHLLFLVTRGSAAVESTSVAGARTARWSRDNVTYFPADGLEHTHSITSADGCQARVFCIPATHLPLVSERPASAAPATSFTKLEARTFNDGPLAAFLHRLPSCYDDQHPEGAGDEIAGRNAIARFRELTGQGVVASAADRRMFTPAAMSRIVTILDGHLGDGFPPAGIHTELDLSPSHFAKKFRHSTGISLQRFINRRRIRRSIALLGSETVSIVDVANGLGFSSQSHFTRVFSAAVGIAPGQFQRLRARSRG